MTRKSNRFALARATALIVSTVVVSNNICAVAAPGGDVNLREEYGTGDPVASKGSGTQTSMGAPGSEKQAHEEALRSDLSEKQPSEEALALEGSQRQANEEEPGWKRLEKHAREDISGSQGPEKQTGKEILSGEHLGDQAQSSCQGAGVQASSSRTGSGALPDGSHDHGAIAFSDAAGAEAGGSHEQTPSNSGADGSNLGTQEKSSPSQIEEIELVDRQLLRKLVALGRLNTKFRIESTKQPPFRYWRQTVYSVGNGAATLSGTIQGMAFHFANTHGPKTTYSIKKIDEKSGQIEIKVDSTIAKAHHVLPVHNEAVQEPQMVGNCVGGIGDIFELGLDIWRSFELKRLGYDGKTYRKGVLALRSEMDTLLAKRDQLVKSLATSDPAHADIARAESRILRDFRDLYLVEYAEYHAGARRLHWYQNGAYIIDLAKNATGFTGSLISTEGDQLNRARYTGSGALMTLISGLLIIGTPYLGRVSGNYAGLVDRRLTNRDYGRVLVETTGAAARDRKAVVALVDKVPEASRRAETLVRLRIYDHLTQVMYDHEQNHKRQLNEARKSLKENLLYGTLVGSSKTALGICGLIASWKYYDKPWIASRYVAAGNTAYTAGSAFVVAENTRVLAAEQWRDLHWKKEGISPIQIYQARLGTLDQIDRDIDKMGTPALVK